MQVLKGLKLPRRLTWWGSFAVLLIASLNSGCTGLASSNSGQTKLTDSTPTVTAISATSATITWTTNIAGTSQVVYGPTTNYGEATPFNSTLVTSHAVVLTNLTAGIQYHYICNSQAADGSTVTTPDATFTTEASSGDTTPPTVSITAPLMGAEVSGTIPVTANATDNVAVASVQFQIDGVNAGAAVTAAPYSYSWNTTAATNGNHAVSAIAVDTSGNATTSAVVTVVVNNAGTTAPPVVSITAPANNATVSGTVAVSATATSSVGVASVQFQLDGVNLGAGVTSAPYSVSWNTSSGSNGSHFLIAVAKDTAGNTATSAAVSVTVHNASNTPPPAVSITAPANNATVKGTVTVSATATDSVGVTSVQFQLDGANLGSADTSAPYSVSWNTTSAANGSHTLTAIAKGTNGGTATSAAVTVTVNNSNGTLPAVAITAPANNATLSGTVSVTASASDSLGVASVQFQVDGTNAGSADATSPYSFSWNTTKVANGSHTLTAVAMDTAGNTATSAVVKVTVSNAPPAVSITSPAGGSTVTGTVAVSATASSSMGVASVQLQVDGSNVGSADTSSPYNFSLNSANYPNGSHALTAVAKDTAGNSTTSAAVNVIVSNQSTTTPPPPGTLGWTDIANQQINGNCPPDNFGGYGYDFADNCSGVVDDWASGIADTKRNRLWMFGGGHNGYAGNEVYYFDLTTNTMHRADDPADPTPTCTISYSNGTPSAKHTYGGQTYIANADVMFLFGGGGYCPSGGFASSDTWTLNLSTVGTGATSGWTHQDSTLGNGGVHPCGDFNNSQTAYDPNTGLVFVNDSCGGSGLWSYNYSTNSYTQLSSAAANMTLHEDVVIDPSRKLFLRFGDGTAQKISIAPGSAYAVTNLTATGCSALMNASNPGLAFDTVTNTITGWPNFGPTVYIYNPDTDSCTTQTYSTNAPPNSSQTGSADTSNGTFGRFQYFPAMGVYALVNEWNIDAHTLRLTSGGGSSSGSSSLTISNVAASNITTSSATITWTTSASATAQVMYGTTSSLGLTTSKNTSLQTTHSQNMTGLSPSTLYFFAVQSADGSGTTVTASGFSFGTTNTGDTTPPTVSMTAPANGATVTGTVTVSANASDNVALKSVQFLLDGASLGSAVTASPYSVSWNTSSASNGSHTLSATATDSSGNTATSAAVSVTVSNSNSNAEADFQARCAGAGVLRCVAFDTAADIQGNAAPGMPKIIAGLTTPTIDTTQSASGGGSLLFAVPASAASANTSGSFDIDFSDDFSAQIDSLINGDPASLTTACGGSPCGNEIWIQWRQRFDQNMLQHFAGSNGFKQIIVGEGDTSSTIAYSCSDIETVVENSNQFEIPRMYHSCGVKLDEYDPLDVNTGKTDSNGNGIFSPQNAAGGYLNCTYTAEINIPTIPPCVPYVANQWMTFQLHIKVGTWYPGGVTSSGGPPGVFKHDSTIQLYVAQEGQPSQIVMDFRPGATSAACDAIQQDIPSCQTGYDLVNPTAYGQVAASGSGNPHVKFGKLWLLNYQTDKCNAGCPNEPAANTWYDELIISRQQVADPKF